MEQTEMAAQMEQAAKRFNEAMEEKYLICCLFCESRTNLEMFAHRKKGGLMVGWIFVCPDCTHLVQVSIATITFESKE